MNYELNKKLIILLLSLTCSLTVSAQLTARQVLEKMNHACDYKSGIQGKATVKMMGIGGTLAFETNGTNTRVVDGKKGSGGSVIYYNSGTSYIYDKTKNTVTISYGNGEMFTLPLILTDYIFNDELFSNAFDEENAGKMKHKDGAYEIQLEGAMTYVIDDKTFHIKSFSMKKGLIRISVTYSNLAPFRDVKSLTYDKSKFPGAKVVDKRAGKKPEASITETIVQTMAETKKKGKK